MSVEEFPQTTDNQQKTEVAAEGVLDAKRRKENAYRVVHALRTLTEGGWQKYGDAKSAITEFLETDTEGKDSNVLVPLRRALEILPTNGIANENNKKIFDEAWSAVNSYRKENNLE